MSEPNLNLAVAGNCQVSALIDAGGRVVWMCLPRHDGDPTFCSLLGGSSDEGYADVQLVNVAQSAQAYRRNTAIIETVLRDSTGGALRIIDFCPRYRRFARMYRPMSLIRIIEPIAGRPVVRLRVRPRYGYGASQPPVTVGSNHIRYQTPAVTLRLTTDASLTTLLEERPFALTSSIAMVMGPDETLTEAPGAFAHAELEATQRYWLDWARGLAVPFEWQEAVIRAAITLKLCTFEDTGAVIAAITTSIPESASSGRNWDYRYCWLRDSYFTVQALNRLGATRTMEAYLRYIMNIIESAQEGALQPLYGISGETQLAERIVESLPGYRSMGPVRVGNQAFEQAQHDVYGAVILASTQAFYDQRLEHPGDHALFERLEELGERAATLYDKPDSGLWEYRGRTRVHTFSSVMCWAGCDRLARIAHTPRGAPSGQRSGARARMRCTSASPGWRGTRSSAASPRVSSGPSSTRACCSCRSSVSWARTIRVSCRRCRQSKSRCGASSACCATTAPMTSVRPRMRSTSAASGSSTRSP